MNNHPEMAAQSYYTQLTEVLCDSAEVKRD